MKINFIESDKETEITLKGKLSNPEVAQLLHYLEQLNSPDKLLLYREECVYPIANHQRKHSSYPENTQNHLSTFLGEDYHVKTIY